MEDPVSELRRIRENTLRESAYVIHLWMSGVESKLNRLGQGKWPLLEQVLIAALDVGQFEISQTCLGLLKKQFPNSSRVNRLSGMFLEAMHRYEEARTLYTQIIEKDATNTVARKRLVAVHKAQGQINDAISELNDYLKIFMSDSEAWGELCDLYLTQGDYRHAAFCMEEVMLANPHNYLLHERFAEIKYSEGGTENLEMARAYFSQARILNPKSVRALYGIILVTASLSGKTISTLSDEAQREARLFTQVVAAGGRGFDSKRDNPRLLSSAARKLAVLYGEAGLEAPFSIGCLQKCGKSKGSDAKRIADYEVLAAQMEELNSSTTTEGEEDTCRLRHKKAPN